MKRDISLWRHPSYRSLIIHPSPWKIRSSTSGLWGLDWSMVGGKNVLSLFMQTPPFLTCLYTKISICSVEGFMRMSFISHKKTPFYAIQHLNRKSIVSPPPKKAIQLPGWPFLAGICLRTELDAVGDSDEIQRSVMPLCWAVFLRASLAGRFDPRWLCGSGRSAGSLCWLSGRYRPC